MPISSVLCMITVVGITLGGAIGCIIKIQKSGN